VPLPWPNVKEAATPDITQTEVGNVRTALVCPPGIFSILAEKIRDDRFLRLASSMLTTG